MFHHNQIFDVTVGKREFPDVIALALRLSEARNEDIVTTKLPGGAHIVGTHYSEGWDLPVLTDTHMLAARMWRKATTESSFPEPPDLDGRMEQAVRVMSLYTAQQAGIVPPCHELPAHVDPDDAILALVPAWLADAK